MAAIPKPVANFVSLFFGPLYLVLLAAILSQATQVQMITAVIVVGLGSVAMMVLLLMLCSRLAAHEPSKKYSVATLLLVISMLAIYMAFVRQLIVPLDMTPFQFADYVSLVLYAALFIVISTTVLVHFTSAFVSLMEIFLKILSPNSRHS